ncbi:MAG: glycosyltransferase family 9 protein [Candidatus Saganbacteria bacterium]|nr:glycosyltransferase family 9 protein [Candidatus Saganbacteria bacterium]
MLRMIISRAIRLRINYGYLINSKNVSQALKETEKVLILAFYGIGDSLMLTPAIRALKQFKPDLRITIITKKEFRDLFCDNPYIDEVITIEKNNFLREAKKLRAQKFDLFLMFISCFEYYLFGKMLHPRYRAGYLSSYHEVEAIGFKPVNTKNPYTNAVKRNLRVIEALTKEKLVDDKKNQELNYFIQPDPITSETAKKIKDLKDKNIRLIGINPNKTATWKGLGIWPLENFAIVANKLLENDHLAIVLFGSKPEQAHVAKLVALIDKKEKVINLAGKTTLNEAAHILRECSLFITTDSGLMHLALALNIPVISLFGFSDPDSFSSSPDNIVLWGKAPCSPCVKNHFDPITNYPPSCATPWKCMELIKPDQVLKISQEILK